VEGPGILNFFVARILSVIVILSDFKNFWKFTPWFSSFQFLHLVYLLGAGMSFFLFASCSMQLTFGCFAVKVCGL